MKLQKTQHELVSRLVNRFNTGGAKYGWTLTQPKNCAPFLTLQKLNEGNAAGKLAAKYPDVFQHKCSAWRLEYLFLINDEKARELLK